jgi:hypothetical protein
VSEGKPIKAVKLLGKKLAVFRLPLAPGEKQPRMLRRRLKEQIEILPGRRADGGDRHSPFAKK